ncbi:MAG: SelL-related redox protein [Capsulimonadaceae bacterium]
MAIDSSRSPFQGEGRGKVPNTSFPSVGDRAPDAVLTGIDGNPVSLSSLWAERPAAIVFLRHLGCVFCREQLSELRRENARLSGAGLQVCCIAQGDAKVGKAYSILFDLPFPLLLCGPDLDVYRRYGLSRAGWTQLFNPYTIARGLMATLRGSRQGDIVGDGFQLGGAFVVDSGGVVRLVHRSKRAGDHISMTALISAGFSIRRGE